MAVRTLANQGFVVVGRGPVASGVARCGRRALRVKAPYGAAFTQASLINPRGADAVPYM